jgi:hypothetical protein
LGAGESLADKNDRTPARVTYLRSNITNPDLTLHWLGSIPANKETETERKTMNESPTANRDQIALGGNRKNAHDNLVHAGEFTKIENTAIVYVLRGWFGALIRPENATEIVQASDDVWANQTLFEHFDSELNSDATTRTPESRAVLAELKARAEAAQERLNKLIGDTDEDERINELTDKNVKEVLDKLGF